MKKLTKIAALTALMMGGQAFAAQDNPVKIAVLMYGMKAEFVQLMEKSAKEHPAVKNGEAIITVYDGRYDPMVQNNQAETAIQTKADAIIINPMDYEANIDVVTMANDAKIPVIVTNARLNTDKMTAEVVSDDVLGGYMEAKAVLEKMNCEGNVVIIEGPKGGSGEIQRGEGNDKAIAECGPGKVKVLERKTANWSRAEAMPLMENWLQKHRGKIGGVIAQNDEMALGALRALQTAGKSDVMVVGFDGTPDGEKAVNDGKLAATIAQLPEQIGATGVETADKVLKGEKVQAKYPVDLKLVIKQ